MSTAELPPSFPYAHPEPPPEYPELPEGVERRDGRPRWRPWTSVVALIAGLAGALMGAIVIGVIAAAFGAGFSDPPPAVNIMATVVQDLCLVASALFFARLVSAPRPAQFGLNRTRFWPALGWIFVAWFAFFAFTLGWVEAVGADPADDELPSELGADESTVALIAVAFLVTVMAPIAEEFFFRGYFFAALRNWKGLWPAAILTGLVFGGIHAGSSDVAYLVPLAFFGFALCLLYARTGSLYPCIVLHCANNSLALGVSQDWGWEIAVLFVSALAVITAGALAVRRYWDAPAPPAPAVA